MDVYLGKPHGLCPICGERVTLTRKLTANGRLIATCGDAFTIDQWERDNCGDEYYDKDLEFTE